jgi:hypothetical protein
MESYVETSMKINFFFIYLLSAPFDLTGSFSIFSTTISCSNELNFKISQCSVTCGTGIRVREPVCMRLYPRSNENPHPIKNGTRVDPKFCSHLEMPKYEKTKKVCKSKNPCIHSFRWVVGPWQKVSFTIDLHVS